MMLRLTSFLVVVLALPAAAQTVTPSSRFAERFAAHAPRLKAAATVVGDVVRVGDLIDHAGAAANIPIFRSPGLGETGRVDPSRVVEAVLPHGIVDLDIHGLTEVVVTRASRAIGADELAKRIVRALADRQRGTDAGNLTLNFDSEVRTIYVEPATDLRIARLTFDQRSGRFDVLFERPGSTRSYLRLTGTYAETFEAAVLTRPLALGDVVKAADITLQRRPKAESGTNVITSPVQAIGLAVRRAMRSGDVIRQTDLTKPEVVARNDNVAITYEVPGITLTMRGKALEAGAQGDVVNVLNEHSKRSIQATVVGRGHVMVAAPRLHVSSATTPSRLAADATGLSNPRANAK